MNSQMYTLTAFLLIVIGLFFAIGLLTALTLSINRFRKELHYLNMEIKRTEGEARQYWIWERRQLWLSLLPFYRR